MIWNLRIRIFLSEKSFFFFFSSKEYFTTDVSNFVHTRNVSVIMTRSATVAASFNVIMQLQRLTNEYIRNCRGGVYTKEHLLRSE